MNTDAIRRFLMFLSSTLKVERGELYQLVGAAETGYLWRDLQSQRDIGLALQAFSYPFNQVGKYYESVYLLRTGQYQKAREILEGIVESAPAHYRSRALLSLSAIEEILGRFEESLRLRLQVSLSDDPIALLEAKWGIATVRGREGDHRAALRDLERLMPLAHIIGKSGHPAFTKFLNGYALELSESNRSDEAEQVANIIAASPFISRYPEWRDTITEIEAKRKRPSMVAVPHELQTAILDTRVQAAIDYMKDNLHKNIGLDELTTLVELSSSQFSQLFKLETGVSSLTYLRRLRLDKAAALLATTFKSVKQVMAAVGYNDAGYLSRHFKRHFGVSPTVYRKKHRRR